MNNEPLTPEAIMHDLPVQALPRRVLCYAQVSSTMNVAREQIDTLPAAAFPLLVQADEQTAGRGRLGRPWSAPPGSALLFSLALPAAWLDPARAVALVWMAGVALCEAIHATTSLCPRLKWPNDVLLPTPPHQHSPSGMSKVAGILLESVSTGERIEWVVLGCGLNVHAHPPPAPTLRYPATSLATARGEPVERLALMRAILTHLDGWYTRLNAGDYDALFATWRALLVTPGQQVQIHTGSGTISGLAEDVEPSGSLRVRDAAGQVHIITNGDVSG